MHYYSDIQIRVLKFKSRTMSKRFGSVFHGELALNSVPCMNNTLKNSRIVRVFRKISMMRLTNGTSDLDLEASFVKCV